MKKMEDNLNKIFKKGRRPKKNGRQPQILFEDEQINQNQLNWL